MKLKFLIPAIVSMIVSVSSFAQTTEHNYYVTIGVYGIHQYAVLYTEKANKNNFSAQYAINPSRKLYYVYLFSTPDRAKAIAFMLKIRLETEYKEAWVFGGSLGDSLVDAGSVGTTPEKPGINVPEPSTRQEPKPAVVTPEPKKEEPKVTPEPKKEEPKPEMPKPEEPKKDSVTTPKIDTITAKKPEVKPAEKPVVVEKHEGIPFNFKLINQETGAEIVGEVHIQESSKASQYQAFRGNEVVYIKAPVNADHSFVILTNAPGYKQIKETIDFTDPSKTTGVTKGDKNEFIIPLDLKRAKHGDYIDFNNVKFIRNSSIMTPESQTELDGLVLLMKDNLKYKISIHGHCNGKVSREIITQGSSTNYFAMDPRTNIKETASAVKLSEQRALAVKGYLVSQGIAANRVATKGEGGKIPLYPATSTLNAYNDRVEIEVKKN